MPTKLKSAENKFKVAKTTAIYLVGHSVEWLCRDCLTIHVLGYVVLNYENL